MTNDYRLTVWNDQGASTVTMHESVEAAERAMVDTWADPENLTASIEGLRLDDEPCVLECWNGVSWYDTATA